MYESPINVFERNICNKLTEEKENLVIAAVQEVGVTVDKEELKKALRYDRQQYEKGYADAKQAAIDALKVAYWNNDIQSAKDDPCIVDAMTDWAIRQVKALPSAQPEQDREFIKLTVKNSNGRPYYSIIYLEFDDNDVGHDFEGYSSYSLDVISDYLKKYFMTSAQPERKTGKWETVEGWDGDVLYRCSECGTEFVLIDGTPEENDYHFCPNCGARMEGKLE